MRLLRDFWILFEPDVRPSTTTTSPQQTVGGESDVGEWDFGYQIGDRAHVHWSEEGVGFWGTSLT